MANEQNLNPFKKGQSGNPKGRPVGRKSRSTIAKKWLETPEKFKNPITGEIEELMTSTSTKTAHYLWNETKKNYSVL
jgi:hypothetical protein